jgi:hypothetical protein
LDVVRQCRFWRRGQPDDFEYRCDSGLRAGFEKWQGTQVATQAAVIGSMMRFRLGSQRGTLRHRRHAQQEHDKQCFPVAVVIAHDYKEVKLYNAFHSI